MTKKPINIFNAPKNYMKAIKHKGFLDEYVESIPEFAALMRILRGIPTAQELGYVDADPTQTRARYDRLLRILAELDNTLTGLRIAKEIPDTCKHIEEIVRLSVHDLYIAISEHVYEKPEGLDEDEAYDDD